MGLFQLKYFPIIAIPKAAELLYIAHSSLSMALKRPEYKLGVPLFDRNEKNA